MTNEKVVVKINGAEYTLKGDGSESYLYSIATYVDRMLKDILKSNPMHSNTSAAVLTALTVTDELFRTDNELRQVKNEVNIPKEREAKLQENYKQLKEAYIKLNSEMETYKKEKEEDNNLIKSLEEKNDDLFKELKSKIDKYSKVEEEINKLKSSLREAEEINKVLIKKNESIKNQAIESFIEATTLKKEIKEFKEARINSETV